MRYVDAVQKRGTREALRAQGLRPVWVEGPSGNVVAVVGVPQELYGTPGHRRIVEAVQREMDRESVVRREVGGEGVSELWRRASNAVVSNHPFEDVG